MGISLNIDTNNENEFNQQLQLYLAQGYSMQSNFNGTAILKKKSYSTGVLIVLIIFFFPGAIIYYLLASDDIVTIRNNNGQSPINNNVGPSTQSFDLYCEECGHGLFKDSKFCPGCGKDLSTMDEEPVEAIPEENEIIEEKNEEPSETIPEEDGTVEEALVCNNCGTELTEENKFCPNCGESLTPTEE